jgi:4-hydroxyphenylpyruvate dioxygenase
LTISADSGVMSPMTTIEQTASPSTPAGRLLGWDCVEMWVGNARTTAGFLMSAFGFTCTAYAGPETGVREKASYVLEQGDIRFVVSGALDAGSPIAEHVRKHGDGVHDLAWMVDDATAVYEAAIARGAKSVRAPWTETDDHGTLELAQIGTYGETVHTFVSRARYVGDLLEPGYGTDNLPPTPVGPAVGLQRIDHVVGNVEKGKLDDWVRFYGDVLGFGQLLHFDDNQIATEYSALMSTVVWDGSKIVMPINEPADGLKKSQIQEYVETYDGPGVQHIALRTDDIVASVQALRDRGVRFMRVPETYYDEAKERLADFELPWDELKRLNILADRDHEGYLLQIFTETITDRPTVFFEIIERQGAKGFGEGNFKALFEAIERDQARRGNL